MTNTYVKINKKFPKGLTELYADVNSEAQKLAIPYMIVGAMARDLVLVHGFDAKIERGTRDVDFGICVESWINSIIWLPTWLPSASFKMNT